MLNFVGFMTLLYSVLISAAISSSEYSMGIPFSIRRFSEYAVFDS